MSEAAVPIPLPAARALLLRAQGLLDDPRRAATVPAVLDTITRLGFVQLDSINVVERAHHHILWSRLGSYRPATFDDLHARSLVFEQWTHDASVVPSALFPYWHHRFRQVERWPATRWHHQKLGARGAQVLAEVLARIRAEGPRMARDFDAEGHTGGPWWDWKPAKAALEYWWRAGRLAIARRINFHKVYDLTERVLPGVHAHPAPSEEELIDWACRSAIERLGVATTRELAAYWAAVPEAAARAWCAAAVRRGELVPATVAGPDTRARSGFAVADWEARAAEAAERAAAMEPGQIRLLSPFDPLIRDRARCQRLFGFEYRFEAFVPEKKRKFGYYVLPILEHTTDGARLVGRLSPALDRDAGVLRVRGVWWERGVKETRARRRALRNALEKYAAFNGASECEWAGATPRRPPHRPR